MPDRPKLHDPETAEGKSDPLAGLTARQKLFVLAYVGECRGNGYKAAQEAGYQGNRATLDACAYDLLRNPSIQHAIKEYLKPFGVTAERIVAELSDVIRGKMSDVLKRTVAPDGRPEWTIDLSHAMECGQSHLVRKVSNSKFGLTIELHDKLRAIELAGRYLRMWGDRFDDLPGAEDISKMNKEQVKALLSKLG